MSTEPTTEMMNEVIARFMGGKRVQHPEQNFFSEDHFGYVCHKGHWWNENNLQYHTSWDWLMPVWVKFRALSFTEKFRRWNHERHKESIAKSLCDGTIEEVHRYLYRGVVWYQKVNQQKLSNGTTE